MARKDKSNQEDNAPIVAVILLALLLLSGFGWGFGHMGGIMFFGPIFMILVLVLVVWLVVSLTQQR